MECIYIIQNVELRKEKTVVESRISTTFIFCKKGRAKYKTFPFSQTTVMEKVKIYENEGKTREEKETCFPISKDRKTTGVDTR